MAGFMSLFGCVTLGVATACALPSASLAATQTLLWLAGKKGDWYDGSYYGGNGAELLIDESGALYGITGAGGAFGGGTVFKLIPPKSSPPPGYSKTEWIEYIIYDLPSDAPYRPAFRPTNIIFDKAGGILGVSTYGGAKGGTFLYRLSPLPAGQTPSPLPEHTPPVSDERYWQTNVLYNLRGELGGTNAISIAAAPGGGVFLTSKYGIWKISPAASGAAYEETKIYSASYLTGATPDSMGSLYITADYGGRYGKGEVLKLTPPDVPGRPWVKTTLYNFLGGDDGATPKSPPTLDKNGVIYGVASEGGPSNAGLVYSLTPTKDGAGRYRKKTLYAFKGGADGKAPIAPPTLDSYGVLFGTTSTGGASNGGTAFKLSGSELAGWQKTTLYNFSAPNGVTPLALLSFGAGGALYGTLLNSATYEGGGVFKLQLP